jgi:HD superfamily phosphohydrolase
MTTSITSRLGSDLVALNELGLDEAQSWPFLRRLRDVSFLATMEYVYDVRDKPSRLDHSIGAAALAIEQAQILGLGRADTRAIALAFLLHDVGHLPFSHSTEPFLLDHSRRYHDTLLTQNLRHDLDLFGTGAGLRELILRTFGDDGGIAIGLMLREDTGRPTLEALYRCRLNCDSLDGTTRACEALGLATVDPSDINRGLRLQDGSLYFSREALRYAVEFWSQKTLMYEKYIYVAPIFAAEAALSRAMDLASVGKDIRWLQAATDSVLFDYLRSCHAASHVVDNLNARLFLTSLRDTEPRIFESVVQPALDADANLRFDPGARTRIEREVAAALSCDPTWVVTHFSQTRTLETREGELHQRELFQDSDLIPLARLNAALAKERVSGGFFDVFCLRQS